MSVAEQERVNGLQFPPNTREYTLSDNEQNTVSSADERPAKRQRKGDPRDCQDVHRRGYQELHGGTDDVDGLSENENVPAHPLQVRPLGNAYGSEGGNIKQRAGLFARLPDELLVSLLEQLNANELLKLGWTCKALYAFCSADDLWKTLCLRSYSSKVGKFKWRGTWRSSYLQHEPEERVSCDGLFSDVLYRPFYCAHVPLEHYAQSIPTENQIPRLSNLSHDEFVSGRWADRPFILSDPVKHWRAYHDWTPEYLESRYGSTVFRAEATDWPLSTYMQYMRRNTDESPLYLFDCRFVEKMQLHIDDMHNTTHGCNNGDAAKSSFEQDYIPPACFGPDLFAVLGPHRPDSRWLIAGPARSGSTFHVDPNGTSAWNAVLRGRKYWMLCPSAPPGVYVSRDGAEVTAPLSIAEWLLSFHTHARMSRSAWKGGQSGCVEGICGPGEVLHVPAGWFHLVLNLDDALAITQNFVPRPHLSAVLRFLRDRPEQVSGFADDVRDDAYGLFVRRLRETHPDLLDDALAELARSDARVNRPWASVVAVANGEGASLDADAHTRAQTQTQAQGGGFEFGFGFDDQDDDDDNEDDNVGAKNGDIHGESDAV